MVSSLFSCVIVLAQLISLAYAQGGTGAGVPCARECISEYFNNDIGANCTKLAGKSQDWECACEESNFRTAFPCCLEQTCSEDEWDNMHLRGVDYGGLCGREPGSNMEIKLGECGDKDLYYNPSASGFAGSTSSEAPESTTSSAVSSTGTSETSPTTTQGDETTDPADSQEQESDSSGSGGGGDNIGLGLGVGLGVGIPLLIVGMSVVYFLFWRTKRKDKPPSEESGDIEGSMENRESTIVGSEDMSKSRPMSELPVSPSMGSPYAPSELPSNWGRDSLVAYELPAEESRRSAS